MKNIIFYSSLILCLWSLNQVNAIVGDQIYHNCSPTQLGQICITIVEAPNCAMNITFNLGDTKIFNDIMDKDQTEVCGNYAGCTFCVDIPKHQDGSNTRCVTVKPQSCQVINGDINAGCFDDTLLEDDPSCYAQTPCPNGCSGHGSCYSGNCSCNTGYYGDDCSFTSALFDNCIPLQNVQLLDGNLCTRVIYEQCLLGVQMVIEDEGREELIYNKTYRVADLRRALTNGQIASAGPCNISIMWDGGSIQLNDTYASGCGTLSLRCTGSQELVNQPLGCFEDTDIIPSCFTTCPNDCSGHGSCVRGLCQCNAPWGGDDGDCSENPKCPNKCNGHGVCRDNGCSCNEGFTGTSCSIKFSGVDSASIAVPRNYTLVAIPIVFVVLGAIGVVIVYFIRRRTMNRGPQFTQLDIITAEDDDEELAN